MIKFVCFFSSVFDDLIEKPFIVECRVVTRWRYRCELQSNNYTPTIRWNVLEGVMSARFSAFLCLVHKCGVIREGCPGSLLFFVGRIIMRPSSYVNAGLECVTVLRSVSWNDVIVKCILDMARLILTAIQPVEIGVVLGEN